MRTTYITVSLAYALLCLVPAAMKLSGNVKMRTAAEHFDIPWARYQLIGVLELAAAAAAAVGAFWRPAGLVAAIGMTVLLIGAVTFHRRAKDAAHEYAAALVFLAASAGYLALWLYTTPRT